MLLERIYEFDLRQKLDENSALEFTKKAITSRNLRAIEVIAEKHPRAVAEVLQLDFSSAEFILESTSLIFQIKEFFPEHEKQVLISLIIPKLFRHAERILKSIDRSKYPRKVPYVPGKSWHLEHTIANYLGSGDPYFMYKHVICYERKRKEKSVILLIDHSHSVLTHLRLIILASILFSMIMDIRDMAIIGFDTDPRILKSYSDHFMTSEEIIQKLINIRSGGKTNIYTALKATNKEFKKVISRKKTLVLISDLLATTGFDFIPLLSKMQDVRIIITPKRQALQLTTPLFGKLRKLPNIKLFYLPSNERNIPLMLERVLFD
ncbi:MAG: VWA domain-containing protein [Candidatus Heimdallarchaeota archaeon]|nr:VWA domain-containing protein [Candidatus Heimdallarchaeota archaeon]